MSKDNLRAWERRYGFPQPSRDAKGERLYPSDQVEKLRILRRLLDTGLRPAGIIHRSLEDLRQLSRERSSTPRSAFAAEIFTLLEIVKAQAPGLFRKALRFHMLKLGIRPFVAGLVADLNAAVGVAWQRGELSVADEHCYSEQIEAVLRGAIDGLQIEPRSASVLLTTLPGEQHKIGLLMLEAFLASEGIECMPLGTQTPVSAIEELVTARNIDFVVLSFSGAFPKRAALKSLGELRAVLPADVAVRAGGDGVKGLRKLPDGVLIPRTFSALAAELRQRRNE